MYPLPSAALSDGISARCLCKNVLFSTHLFIELLCFDILFALQSYIFFFISPNINLFYLHCDPKTGLDWRKKLNV